MGLIESEVRCLEHNKKSPQVAGTTSEEIEIKLPSYLPDEIRSQIINAINNKIPILISGIQGATGKTYLKNILRSQSVIVFEEWEVERVVLNKFISY